jgi:hypothetical protein
MRGVVVALVAAVPALASADEPIDFGGASIVFQRGAALLKADPRGKGEVELATLPDKAIVRALRTDGSGKILLADIGGKWATLPLDGSTKQLADLPCAEGPAQLAEDGACVLCRAAGGGSVIVNLATGKTTPVELPTPGARIAGVGAARKLVWADKDGVWTAAPRSPKQATKVAPQPPVRGFSPSPDGTRAIGIFPDEIFTDAHHKQAADVMMGFQLDGTAARRKLIKAGVPVEWSHDSQWVLVQDHANACLMRATGGEYKCWRGYTAASIASDGRFALVLGNRDGSKKQTSGKKPKAEPAKTEPTEAESEDEAAAPEDVLVAPPSGPLALYRVRLEGSAFTETPVLVTKVIDGAAAWVPGATP